MCGVSFTWYLEKLVGKCLYFILYFVIITLKCNHTSPGAVNVITIKHIVFIANKWKLTHNLLFFKMPIPVCYMNQLYNLLQQFKTSTNIFSFVETQDWRSVYKTTLIVINEPYIQSFQYTIINWILNSKEQLYNGKFQRNKYVFSTGSGCDQKLSILLQRKHKFQIN